MSETKLFEDFSFVNEKFLQIEQALHASKEFTKIAYEHEGEKIEHIHMYYNAHQIPVITLETNKDFNFDDFCNKHEFTFEDHKNDIERYKVHYHKYPLSLFFVIVYK